MLDFLSSISDFFSSIGVLLLNLVEGFVWLVRLIPSAIAATSIYIGYIPSPFIPFAFATVAICIVFMLINR